MPVVFWAGLFFGTSSYWSDCLECQHKSMEWGMRIYFLDGGRDCTIRGLALEANETRGRPRGWLGFFRRLMLSDGCPQTPRNEVKSYTA